MVCPAGDVVEVLVNCVGTPAYFVRRDFEHGLPAGLALHRLHRARRAVFRLEIHPGVRLLLHVRRSDGFASARRRIPFHPPHRIHADRDSRRMLDRRRGRCARS